uniref:Uncharacterized protein n=1 Tax=Tanacetum cinerariifolium TaxID=118510 RepID=A0A699L545_TANCI|nr:hypothetical protein [Tanacetum cinerariifolium]
MWHLYHPGIRDTHGLEHGPGDCKCPISIGQYLFRHDEGRKSGARLNICERVGAGTPGAAEDALEVVEDAQADPTPLQAPQPPVAPRTMPQRIARLEEEGRFTTWMVSCMTQLMDASGRTYQAFDGTLVGSSQLPYHRRTRSRTDNASTSAPR